MALCPAERCGNRFGLSALVTDGNNCRPSVLPDRGRSSLAKRSETDRQSGLDPATSRTLAALLGSESVPAAALGDAVRRLSVLVEVADTVTQRLSLDHQL